jgi:5'(3')-deoxyribonucleotidase
VLGLLQSLQGIYERGGGLMKRLNIGVDVDGVLSSFTSAARKLCKQLFDGRPDDSLIQTSWAFESLGITKAEESIMWKVIDNTPNWWMTHETMPETDLLHDLCDNHRVIFITNRKDGRVGLPIEIQTAQWLKENYGLYNPMVAISDNKGPLAAGLKLDYFIDDRPKNVDEVCRYVPKTALRDATYNQEYPYGWRVRSFNDFVAEIHPELVPVQSFQGGRCIA